ncbi:hypothetical protein [Micromonospora sp. DT231]|uniref:hypothetical protein n=1 Tax=Micromonospora sp. DT231 TaxID=3416526 RepID=UPI003CEAE912
MARPRPTTGDRGDRPALIIHLPTALTSLDEVTALAVALRDSLGHLAVLDFGEITVSEEDAQFLRTRVWCDAVLGGAGRCRRRDAHDGPCGPTRTTDLAARRARRTLRRDR